MGMEGDEVNYEEVDSLEKLCDYIVEHKANIYVREQINGKWGSFALTELPSNLAIDHTLRFIKVVVVLRKETK